MDNISVSEKCEKPIKFFNPDMYNLITEEQLSYPGVLTFITAKEEDIQIVKNWLSAHICVPYLKQNLVIAESVVSMIRRTDMNAIERVLGNKDNGVNWDAVILEGVMNDEVSIRDIVSFAQYIERPVFLVTTSKSMKQQPSPDKPNPFYLSDCITEVKVAGGKVKEFTNIRNIATASGYSVVL